VIRSGHRGRFGLHDALGRGVCLARPRVRCSLMVSEHCSWERDGDNDGAARRALRQAAVVMRGDRHPRRGVKPRGPRVDKRDCEAPIGGYGGECFGGGVRIPSKPWLETLRRDGSAHAGSVRGRRAHRALSASHNRKVDCDGMRAIAFAGKRSSELDAPHVHSVAKPIVRFESDSLQKRSCRQVAPREDQRSWYHAVGGPYRRSARLASAERLVGVVGWARRCEGLARRKGSIRESLTPGGRANSRWRARRSADCVPNRQSS